MIKVMCEVTQTTSCGSTISDPKLIVSSNFKNDYKYVKLQLGEKEFWVNGRDLITAINMCMNINQ